jgi:DNA-binding NarL/FixJ family response regulator/predicted Ser/Thr protein kinase
MTVAGALLNDRFKVEKLIGSGGMGDVYLGTDLLIGDQVAIKQLRPELTRSLVETVERFHREAEALRRLDHPNIVKILATVDEADQHYIVMEYVSGGSLADLLQQEPQLPIDRVVSIGLELSDALSRAHHLQILHRDIKPGNILLAGDGTPRLTDFGLARIGALSPLTDSKSVLGTFFYLPPEVFEGQPVNERSDIWSFGVVLFEMLTGRLPFNAELPFDLMWAIKNNPLPVIENLREGMPPALANLVRRMLRKDNPARVESVRQVGVELESIQKELRERARRMEKSGAVEAAGQGLQPIRVLIVDDHAVVRQGLRMFIDLQEDMEVIGEGTNGAEAIELAEKLTPEVILLDLVMPGVEGVEAAEKIRQVCPNARILILTSFGEDDKIIPAIQAGAQGYLLKDIRPDDLVNAVREAYQGKTQLHPEIARKLMNIAAGRQQSEHPRDSSG